MEADKTSFERIEGTTQANESGLVKQTSPDSGNAAIWKFSCDGIWAVSARSSDLRSGSSPAESLQFSVGTGRRRIPGGKLGVSMVAVATAALLIVFPPLTPEARTQRATEVTMAAARGAATPAGNVIGICDRTPAVRDRLLILLRQALTPAYQGDCAGVTDAWLARLTSVQLVAPGDRVTSLKRGDFAWLPNVRSVYITGQLQLATLPADVFEGLTGLEELWVFENRIATLSSGAFRGLPNLRDL